MTEEPLSPSPKLFPPTLEKKAEGSAVLVLKQFLFAMDFAVAGMVMNDRYDEKVAESVVGLQRSLGFGGAEVTGNFDQPVRDKINQEWGIAVNAIPLHHGAVTFWVAGGLGQGYWPPPSAEEPTTAAPHPALTTHG